MNHFLPALVPLQSCGLARQLGSVLVHDMAMTVLQVMARSRNSTGAYNMSESLRMSPGTPG